MSMSAPCASWCCITKALMDTPCLSRCYRCADLIVSLALARIFLAQPEDIQHCSRDGGLSEWIGGEYIRWTDNCTIVPPDSRVGEDRACNSKGWLSGCGPSAEEMPQSWGVKSVPRSCRAPALTRRDAVWQRPCKCLLERINTLKYSFILFIRFRACIQLIHPSCILLLFHNST